MRIARTGKQVLTTTPDASPVTGRLESDRLESDRLESDRLESDRLEGYVKMPVDLTRDL